MSSRFERFVKGTGKAIKGAFLVTGIVVLGVSTIQKRAKLQVHDGVILQWNWDEIPVEESHRDISSLAGVLTAANPKKMTFLELLDVLKWAEQDDRVRGLHINFSFGGQKSARNPKLGISQLHELRQAIQDFKNTKEKVHGHVSLVAFTDTFMNQGDYYVASVFDDIKMEPLGSIPLVGAGTRGIFVHELFKKLGIGYRISTRKEFKGVVAPLQGTSFSEPVRQNLERVLGSINNQLIDDLATARGKNGQLSETRLVILKAMESGNLNAQKALKLGLIDGILDRSVDPLGMKKEKKKFQDLHWYRMSRKSEFELSDRKSIGIVHLNGQMQLGNDQYGSMKVAKSLIEAGRDPNVASIVLRIDSGGGAAIAAETISQAVNYVQNQLGKPVVASFGNVAASGGYYIAAPCKKIVASPFTVTGSIGVAAFRPIFGPEFLEKVGLNVDEIAFSQGYKNQNFSKDLSEDALKLFEQDIDHIYHQFLEIVSKGRNIPIEKLDGIAGGRVWSGKDAFELGLVDELGGFRAALKTAQELVDPEFKMELKPRVFPTKKSFIDQIRSDDLNLDLKSAANALIKTLVSDVIAEMSTNDKELQMETNFKF